MFFANSLDMIDSVVYAMVVCRSHDTAGSMAHGVFISRPTGKSRTTGKIQTHWQNPDLLLKSRPTGWETNAQMTTLYIKWS